MPRTRPNGREIEAAFMERLWEERRAQFITIRCAVEGCNFTVAGALEDVAEAHREHRLISHPDIKPKHRKHQKNGRIGGVVTKVSLDENVANVRKQGGARWA
jgi:hypothetical protein